MNYINKTYLSHYEVQQIKNRNNRILGFILGVVCTLGAFILWRFI